MGLGETLRRFILKRCWYSSLEKFEDVFDTTLDLIQTKLSDVAFSAVFEPNLEKCRPEAAGDVISGMALEYVGTDVPVTFADYRLKSGRIILDSLCAFCAAFNIILPPTGSS